MADGLGIATPPQNLIQSQQSGSTPPPTPAQNQQSGPTALDLQQLLQLQQPRDAVPQVPQQAAAPETRRRSLIPSFSDNPLGALGLLLRNVAAGYQGRELPSDILIRQQRQQELQGISMRIDKSNHFIKVLDKGLAIAKNIKDPDQRNKALDAYAANFPMFPDAANRLKEISSNTDQADVKFSLLRKHLPALNMLAGGDDQLFDEIIDNKHLVNKMLEANARSKRGFLTKKIPEILEFAENNGIRMNSIDDLFAINDQLPVPLDPLDLDALSRQTGIAARFGLKTQEQALKDLGKQTTTLSKARMQQLGLPEGSVVQQDEDGTLRVVFKPDKEDLDFDAGQETSEIPAPDETLFDLAESATGVVSGALETISDVVGQIPGVPIAEDTIRARQTFETATSGLIRSLSINQRFPVGEIKRLKREVNILPSVFKSPGALKVRMKSLRKSLTLRAEQELRDSKNSRLPEDDRSAALSAANHIKNFLVVLGEPEDEPLTTEEAEELKRLEKKFVESFSE